MGGVPGREAGRQMTNQDIGKYVNEGARYAFQLTTKVTSVLGMA